VLWFGMSFAKTASPRLSRSNRSPSHVLVALTRSRANHSTQERCACSKHYVYAVQFKSSFSHVGRTFLAFTPWSHQGFRLHPLTKSTPIASKLPLDIIHSVFDFLHFATSSDMDPPWRIPFDTLGLHKVRSLNDLALVCRQWVIPARQTALRAVPLYLTEARVNALAKMLAVGLNAGKYQQFVRHLYISFSFEAEELPVN